MQKFIGRKKELARLHKLLRNNISNLIVVKGRRRIGKSRLLLEFGKTIGKSYVFSGLPPEKGLTAADQRVEFTRQLDVYFGLRGLDTRDWGNLFWHLSKQTQKERVLIVFDEISWMAHDDPTFLPKLKVAWDLYFTQNPNIILALCGSISTWIEQNILSSTGFMGRQSLVISLDELPLNDCIEFWNHNQHVAAQEKLMMLAVTGGIPRYLEAIDPKVSAEQNIRDLCFTKEGILFSEFKQIFADLFDKQQELYRKIIENLAATPLDAQTLFDRMGLPGGGDDYQHLENLEKAGFIIRDYTWNIKQGTLSKLSQYRLRDNYCRFYLKYILPNQHRILQNAFADLHLASLPGWSSIVGLQIENLILYNRSLLHQALEISPQEIICDNPFFRRSTANKPGCQIDYLIQTRFNTLYLCEIKFSKNPLQKEVIEEVQQKIKRLAVPKHFSIRPVLIHCNSVVESIEESGYFAKIINFTDFLR